MGQRLSRLTIQGFKSIELLEQFELDRLTVLIGANGSGKSNFVDFFRLLRRMAEEGLQAFLQTRGADGLFYLGPKYTRAIKSRLEFGENVYEFDLVPAADGKLFVSDERVQYTGGKGPGGLRSIGKGNPESRLKALKDEPARMGQERGMPGYVYDAVSSWVVYHFHDTSLLAPMRREWSTRDYSQLRPEADNIAAYLLRLRTAFPDRYNVIRDTVRLIAPFLDDFVLRPDVRGEDEVVRLEWQQKGSDFPFQPSQFSDGTLRFICLATALQQVNPPAAIIIDEPELGLHPYAISILADLINAATQRTQVILATQSPVLLDHFEPESIVVVNRKEGHSSFERLDADALKEWLEEYSVGELWQKNVVQGSPSHE